MMPTNLPENVSAEVIDRTSNGFTSKLVWQSVSTEVNGSEIGCSHSSRICSRDQNLNITLLVTGCQGNGIGIYKTSIYQAYFICIVLYDVDT